MVKRTHFYDRLQDRKAIKKSTVKQIILFKLKYLHSFKANAALLHKKTTKELRGRVILQSLGGTNAPGIPCACSGELDKMTGIQSQRRLLLQ